MPYDPGLCDFQVTHVGETSTRVIVHGGYRPDDRAMRDGGWERNGWRVKTIHDTPHVGRPVELHVRVPRYSRQIGGRKSGAPQAALPWQHPDHRVTQRLASLVMELWREDTQARISRVTGLSERTVHRLIKDGIAMKSLLLPLAPRWLGLDEAHLHQYWLTLVDLDTNRLVDVAPGCDKATLRERLMRLQHRERVEGVAIDFTRHYRDVVRAVLPQARVVIDRWHVEKQARDAAAVVFKAWKKARFWQRPTAPGWQRRSAIGGNWRRASSSSTSRSRSLN